MRNSGTNVGAGCAAMDRRISSGQCVCFLWDGDIVFRLIIFNPSFCEISLN